MTEPVPTEIRLRRASRLLEVSFDDGTRYELPFEYLRVHSPSAEVKGHGPGQEVLVVGKQEGAHRISLKKDQVYTITVDSRGLITKVRIENGEGEQLALLSESGTFKAPEEGMFRLVVFSPGGSSGQYVVSVRPLNLTPTTPGEVLTVGPDGLNIEAVLTKEDPIDKVRKKHCRVYDVKMKMGVTYVIDLTSKQFDAFLRLENAGGKQLAQDDDSGGNNNARITYKAPADGVYRIYATTFGLETGLYLLKVREK